MQPSDGSASSLQRTSFSSFSEPNLASPEPPGSKATGDKPSAKEKLAAAFAPVKQGWSLLTQPGRQGLETCRESDEGKYQQSASLHGPLPEGGGAEVAGAAGVDNADAESVQARDDMASAPNSARGAAPSPVSTGAVALMHIEPLV